MASAMAKLYTTLNSLQIVLVSTVFCYLLYHRIRTLLKKTKMPVCKQSVSKSAVLLASQKQVIQTRFQAVIAFAIITVPGNQGKVRPFHNFGM
jgi:hypothetical protein